MPPPCSDSILLSVKLSLSMILTWVKSLCGRPSCRPFSQTLKFSEGNWVPRFFKNCNAWQQEDSLEHFVSGNYWYLIRLLTGLVSEYQKACYWGKKCWCNESLWSQYLPKCSACSELVHRSGKQKFSPEVQKQHYWIS